MNTKKIILMLNLILTSATLAMAGEVWVSPVGVDGTGKGTAASPYVRSSQKSFDALMSGPVIPANSLIHLTAGTFLTIGGVPLKPGWKFRGAGIDVTTVKMTLLTTLITRYGSLSNYENHVLGIPPLGYRNDGVEVSDMTIDCNLQNQTLPMAVGAVHLQGANTKISRVKAVNWGSRQPAIECFIFGIGAFFTFSMETNCLIEDCIVQHPAQVVHSQGSDGFMISGGPTNQLAIGDYGWVSGAEIRNCRVYDVRRNAFGCPTYFSCSGIGNGVCGAKIDGNLFVNVVGSGVFSSCGSLTDCSIDNNKFLGISSGINFVNDDYCPDNKKSLKKNIRISDNLIIVPAGGYGIHLNGIFGNTITDLAIENNLIKVAEGGHSMHGIVVEAVSSLIIQNNTLDDAHGTPLELLKGVTISRIADNKNLSGQNVGVGLKTNPAVH